MEAAILHILFLVYQQLPTLLVSIGGIVAIVRGISKIHIELNDRLSELIAVTKELAHAKGVAVGRAEVQEELRKQNGTPTSLQ